MSSDKSLLRFDGRVAIVTGAGGSAGLGRAHARLLAERGAKVVVNDLGSGRDGTTGEYADAKKVAAEIVAAGGEAVADLHSVAEEDSAKAVVQTALDAWGRVDILINNAMAGALCGFEEITSKDIERIVGVNLLGAIWMCRAAWPHMRAAGYGRIVNTTSDGMMGMRGMTIYGASKFGMFGLTRGLASEGADCNIKVNALSPGAATNSMGRFFTFVDENVAKHFCENFGPERVAPAVAYLVHEDCKLTGGLFNAAGGKVSSHLIGATAGMENPDLTIEDVRDGLDAILDVGTLSIMSDPRTPIESAKDPMAGLIKPKPYEPDYCA
jgi:NAD(P)-dependent dehydrogenase (short-subunit alcohol dehydrogenase family)